MRGSINGAWFCVLGLTLLLGCGGEGGELAITGVEPAFGALQGEQPIRITGANFRTDLGYTVYFGSKKATSVTILDSETLLATTPTRDEEGQVDITIAADNGPAFRIPNGFAYKTPGAGDTKKAGNLAY